MKKEKVWIAMYITILLVGGAGVVPFAWWASGVIWDSGIHGFDHIAAVLGSLVLYLLVWVGLVTWMNRVAGID